MVYAVTSHTPAEIVAQRANHRVENMGLQTWPKDNIQKRDVGVSKNYLAEGEIKELNRLTTILLDIFEDQLDIGRLVVMQDARNLLDQQLAQLGRAVLKSGGSIRGDSARQKAEAEYVAFDKQRRLERKRDAEAAISALAAEAKKLPKTRRH